MEPLFLKFFICGATAILTGIGVALRYIFMKFDSIVPKDEIKEMINDATAPEVVRTNIIAQQLLRIDNKLDRVMEIVLNVQRSTKE